MSQHTSPPGSARHDARARTGRLDESVPRPGEVILERNGYRFSTTKQLRMTGRSDEDQAALCWRENRILDRVRSPFDSLPAPRQGVARGGRGSAAVQASSRYSDSWMFSQLPRRETDSARADRRLPASIIRAGISLCRRGT